MSDSSLEPVNNNALSCIALNVGSFKSKLCFPGFIQMIKKHDIFSISESKLSDIDSVCIEFYTPFLKIE